MCSSALYTVDDANNFLVIRLGPKTSECEKNVIVMSTVTDCEVSNCATTLHGFNKHASSRRDTENKLQNQRLFSRVDRSTRPLLHTFCL